MCPGQREAAGAGPCPEPGLSPQSVVAPGRLTRRRHRSRLFSPLPALLPHHHLAESFLPASSSSYTRFTPHFGTGAPPPAQPAAPAPAGTKPQLQLLQETGRTGLLEHPQLSPDLLQADPAADQIHHWRGWTWLHQSSPAGSAGTGHAAETCGKAQAG